MDIRFKCPHCKKVLRAGERLAGRRTACTACRKPIVIPKPKQVPSAAEMEDLAAKLLGDDNARKPEPKPVAKAIKFTCEFCDAEIEAPFEEAGKKTPCPECKHIVRIPEPNDDKPKDWRDLIKKGPSAALINQPEQLENAWGTEQKMRVSQGALIEGGAIEDDLRVEPVGVLGWLKRGFWTVTIGGLLVAAALGVRKSNSEREEQQAIDKAVDLVALLAKPVPDKKVLSESWAAEIHRVAGELYCERKKAAKARQQFSIARARVQRALEANPADSVEADLLLIELALSQVELGGTEEEAIGKERLLWSDAQKEISLTLETIAAPEARMLAMRLVGTRLGEKNQSALAVGLAGQLSSPAYPGLVAEQVALFLSRKEDKQAEQLLPRPQLDKMKDDKTNKIKIELLPRIAYGEGLARLGDYEAALELAKAKGEPLHRLEACLGCATLALADNSLKSQAEKTAKAQPFVLAAVEACGDKALVVKNLPPWLLYELLHCSACIDGGKTKDEKLVELAKTLDPAFQPRIQLVRFRQQLDKGEVSAIDMEEFFKEKDCLPCAMAYEALARQQARQGKTQKDILGLADAAADERLLPFLLAGMAQGEHDRRK